MSKYTIELRHIINNGYEIGLNEYPIFDETYRSVLNNKIINHFYFYEIGFQTVEHFKHYLKAKMNEIMPYYNKLYETTIIDIDPTISFKRTATTEQTSTGTGNRSDTIENTDHSRIVHSETPTNLLQMTDIESEVFASDAHIDNTERNQTNTSNVSNNNTGNITVNESGHNEPLSDLIVKYRKQLLNIDVEIIKELKTLFMQVY
jgi:hypothetical protein